LFVVLSIFLSEPTSPTGSESSGVDRTRIGWRQRSFFNRFRRRTRDPIILCPYGNRARGLKVRRSDRPEDRVSLSRAPVTMYATCAPLPRGLIYVAPRIVRDGRKRGVRINAYKCARDAAAATEEEEKKKKKREKNPPVVTVADCPVADERMPSQMLFGDAYYLPDKRAKRCCVTEVIVVSSLSRKRLTIYAHKRFGNRFRKPPAPAEPAERKRDTFCARVV